MLLDFAAGAGGAAAPSDEEFAAQPPSEWISRYSLGAFVRVPSEFIRRYGAFFLALFP